MNMKLKRSFVIVWLTMLLNLASGKKKCSVVPYAINAIIEQYFVNLENSAGRVGINFISDNDLESSKLRDQLLKIKSANTKVTVLNTNLDDGEMYELGDSGIVIFDSVKRFLEKSSSIWWVTDERHQNHHLVYVPGLTTLDIIKTFEDGFLIDHVNFLMHETDNSIELVTTYMFTPQACKELQFKTINRFNLQTLEWENSIFYPNKYENFYGCKLIVAHNQEDFFNLFHYNLMKMIFEEQLNAKLVLTRNEDPLCCEKCDLTIQKLYIKRNYHDKWIRSDPVNFESFRIVIGPGEPYTDLERMFMMFDFELWIAISVTFSIALIATVALNFISRKIRNFIVGRYVQNPTMNMISIFLTGSQARTPGRNFARFILMLFIFWSLIIRTCHQSMLFTFMQADLRRPTIKTLDEFFQSNLTYYDFEGAVVFDEYFEEQMNKSSTRLVNW